MNTGTLEDYLAVVAPSVPGELVSRDNLAHIKAVARFLPRQMTSYLGLECRLGTGPSRVDLAVATNAREAAVLGGRGFPLWDNSELEGAEDGMSRLVWSCLRQFYGLWAEAASGWPEQIDSLWLELDVDGRPAGLPVPNFFFRLRGGVTSGEGGLAAEGYRWIAQMALPVVLGRPVAASLEKQMLACLVAARPARLVHVGLMLPRTTDSLRLVFGHVPISDVPAVLSQLGWPGSPRALAARLKPLPDWVDSVALHVDLGERLGAQIGLECYVRDKGQSDAWRPLLHGLIACGLCRPDKAEALLRAWPGYTTEDTCPDRWPENLAMVSSLLGFRARSAFVRSVHHVKLTYDPAGGMEAKAYLAIEHRWLWAAAEEPER
ncbi:MAG: hypothetical protein AB1791_05045 [Chloroflexota bacterium]